MKNPAPHYLRKNHGSSVPSQVCVVDVEPSVLADRSNPDHELHRCGAITSWWGRLDQGKGNGGEWLDCLDPLEFWHWSLSKVRDKASLWIVSHDLIYDLTLLGFWGMLDSGFFRLDLSKGPAKEDGIDGTGPAAADGFFWEAGNQAIIIARAGPTRVVLVDAHNYWPGGLADLAADQGRELLPRPSDAAELGEWRAYCGRNAQVLSDGFTSLLRWWKRQDLGVFRYTASGLAWHAYRHRWIETPRARAEAVRSHGRKRADAMMRQSILVDVDPAARQLGRAALAGGECRCFRVGHTAGGPILSRKGGKGGLPARCKTIPGPVYVADVTSLYPSVMRDNLYPSELVGVVPGATLDDLQHWRKYLCLVAEVELVTTDDTYPVMIDGQRHWAAGRVSTTLAGPELLRAVDRGQVRTVRRVALYKWAKLFTGFVGRFWQLRQLAQSEGRPAEASLCKLIMNALPGKLAQLTSPWEDTGERSDVHRWGHFPVINADTGKTILRRSIAGEVQEEAAREETENSMPAIAAYVTSYARVWMAEARRAAGESEVIYQDTDSLHLTAAGWWGLQAAGLVGAGELGKFRLVQHCYRAEYRGLKDYTTGDDHCISGLKAGSVQVNDNLWLQQLAEGFDSVTADGPRDFAVVTTEAREVGAIHPGGVLHTDGRVSPTVVWEGRALTRASEAAAALSSIHGSCKQPCLDIPGSGSTKSRRGSSL